MLRTSHIVSGCFVIGAGFWAWSAAAAEYPPGRADGGAEDIVFPVLTAVVRRLTLVQGLPFSARLRATRRREIMARTGGDAGSLPAGNGKHVRAARAHMHRSLMHGTIAFR
jgi:multidrug efflux pump subunit AcrA (membrane-fusion protein)